MFCADLSFLVDYLNGEEVVEAWLVAPEQQPIHAPTVSLLEVYRGVLRANMSGGLDGAVDGLDWTEPIEFTDAAAQETAKIEHELRATGERIGFADRQIGGVAREAGATLVTRDDHFERIDGLDVERYDLVAEK